MLHCVIQFLPAVAQGAIAIETRDDDADVAAICAVLHDRDTDLRVRAERTMNLALHGSCQVPIAGFATLDGDALHLRALVGDAASGELLRAESKASAHDPESLGRHVAEQLRALGADRLLHPHH